MNYLYIILLPTIIIIIINFVYNIQLCFTRVAHNSHATDRPVALEFPIELEFRNVDFCGGRKIGELREKPSEQGREPTTNSTQLWYRVQDSNPGHIGGRRA